MIYYGERYIERDSQHIYKHSGVRAYFTCAVDGEYHSYQKDRYAVGKAHYQVRSGYIQKKIINKPGNEKDGGADKNGTNDLLRALIISEKKF